MANIKFSGFTAVTDIAGIQEIVGYNGTANVRISPVNFINSSGGPYLPLVGGTMVGAITMSGADDFITFNVNNAAVFDNSNNNNPFYIRNSGGNAATLQIGTGSPGGNVKFLIEGGGNVGIGTTAPSEKLEVQDGNIKIETTTNLDAKLILNPYSDGLGTSYQWNIDGRGSAGNYAFQISEGSTPYLNISNSAGGTGGNVGIGTTSPGVKLDVDGQIRSDDSFLLNSGATAIGSIRNQAGALDIRGDSTRDVSLGSVTSPQALFIEGSNGNVGIGTTSPGAKLEVNSGGGIHLSDNTAGRTLIIKPSLTGTVHEFTSDNTAAGYSFSNNASEFMRIASNGSLQFNAYDDSNNTGAATFLLGTDANGNVVKTTTVPSGSGGPFLPLTAGATKKLTNELYIQGTNSTGAESVLLRGVSTNDGDWLGSIRTANVNAYNQEMRFYTSDANGTTNENLVLTLGADQSATFTGNVTLSSALPLLYLTNTTASTGKNWRLSSATNGKFFIAEEGVVDAVTLDSTTGNATFAGNVTAPNLIATTAVYSSGIVYGSNTLSLKKSNGNSYVDFDTNLNATFTGNVVLSNTGDPIFDIYRDGGSGHSVRLHSEGVSWINNNNNFGIGTTTPASKLEVDGDVLIKSGEYISWGTAGVTAIEGSTASNKIAFLTNSTEKMRLTSAGNVGIGTTTPDAGALLDVRGVVQAKDSYFLAGMSNTKGYNFHDLGTGWGFKALTGPSRIAIFTDTLERLTVLTNGNIGIGRTSPDAKLHIVQDSTTVPILRLTSDGVANYDFLFPTSSIIELKASTTSDKIFKLDNAGSGKFDIEIAEPTSGLILNSPNGTRYRITVANDGTVTSTAV